MFDRLQALETRVASQAQELAAFREQQKPTTVAPMEVKADSSDNSTVDEESVGPPPAKRRGRVQPRRLQLSDDPEWEPPHKIRVPKPSRGVSS